MRPRPSFWDSVIVLTIFFVVMIGVAVLIITVVGAIAFMMWEDWHATPESIEQGNLIAGFICIAAVVALTLGTIASIKEQREWKREEEQVAEKAKLDKRMATRKRLEQLGLDPDEIGELLR